MPRRSRKQKLTQFQCGISPHNKGASNNASDTCAESEQDSSCKSSGTTNRMDASQFSLVTTRAADQSTLTAPDCDGRPGNVRLLRPRPQPANLKHRESTSTNDLVKGTRMIDNEQMMKMWNDSMQLHSSQSEDCGVPKLIIAHDKKWGLGWKYTLKCVKCDFRSPEYKLYKEVKTTKPGPNPAAINLTFQAGLQDSPVGNTRARLILASANIPPPSRSSMQRTANSVGTATQQLNDKDMTEKLNLVRNISSARGVSDPSEINISTDARYNSGQITSRKKPGQNASQAIGIACETMTDKKFIVGASVQNKLCWTGAWLKGKGMEVNCPGGHAECTANLGVVEPFSEYELGKDIGGQLARQEMLIKHVTTDGDGRSAAGVAQAMKVLDPLWKVERLADPTHVGQSQFRASQRANFSDAMFPGKTRAERAKGHRVFSQDIKARCSLIMQTLMKDHCGDIDKIKVALPKAFDATVRCYDGDCSMCRRHSVVCSGGDSKNWWTRSMFLGANRITNLNMNNSDKVLVGEILKMKFIFDHIYILFYTKAAQSELTLNIIVSAQFYFELVC
jgi:hypothetical protein